MKQISLKKAMEMLGFTEVKVGDGFNYQSAFGKDKNGNIWYHNQLHILEKNLET